MERMLTILNVFQRFKVPYAVNQIQGSNDGILMQSLMEMVIPMLQMMPVTCVPLASESTIVAQI